MNEIEVILVDIGNSKIKSAEVIDGEIGETKSWSELNELNDFYHPSIPFMVCSTRDNSFPSLEKRDIKLLTNDMSLPIQLDYKTPETLGTDRIAAAIGALEIFPNENSLIVDVGTCMTLDLVSADGVFKGGVISPGLTMRMKSMADYTSNLPDISEHWTSLTNSTIGKSTKECLLSGSYWGMIHEINGMVQTLAKDFTTLNVILTGGDAHFFESKLKAHIFAGSKIVQTGLYRIWKY
ncbi:MAG: type III pantothenate kinase [Bacteroidota bacterium]